MALITFLLFLRIGVTFNILLTYVQAFSKRFVTMFYKINVCMYVHKYLLI
jgi:hypothetical protein